MTKATDIVAYIYRAELWTPEGIVSEGIRQGWLSPAARDMSTEDALDMAQHYFTLDRYDECSYDSDEFPKVVFSCMTEDGETARDASGEYIAI